MTDTTTDANTALRRAQRAIELARTTRRPRGQAALSNSIDSATAGVEQAAAELRAEIDSLSELGETESLRLQMAMDRLSKLMSTLSNMLKKASDTSAQITQNIK
ncbi:MAG: hypothetical protein QOG42_1720 [Solirubrobacteraceae bacterium]|jgi:hypothetical protein|nr:hypothetical protein [Solirubrobacteraceae bacterium]